MSATTATAPPSFRRYYVRAVAYSVPTAVMATAYLLSPAESTLGFYTLAAQVIPVLLLALALEARVAPLDVLGPSVAAFSVEGSLVFFRVVEGAIVVAALAIAELCALAPVVQDEAASGNARVVVMAIAGGCAAIGVLAFAGWSTTLGAEHAAAVEVRLAAIKKRKRKRRRRRT
jgi:hypothetical protein